MNDDNYETLCDCESTTKYLSANITNSALYAVAITSLCASKASIAIAHLCKECRRNRPLFL